jgi:hypothetical protein
VIGALVKAASALLGIIQTALGMARDKGLRDQGAQAQQLKDANDELSAIRKGNDAAADPAAIQRVRDEYQIDRPT